jgi:hypothetical protein
MLAVCLAFTFRVQNTGMGAVADSFFRIFKNAWTGPNIWFIIKPAVLWKNFWLGLG